jgi:hypothetical protein
MNPLLIKALPYIGGALVLGGALWWAYDNGRDAERAKWQQKEAVATLKARERENALQNQVDAAGAALSQVTAENEQLRADLRQTRRVYYVQNPAAAAAVCLSDSRFLHHQRADEAANDPKAAAPSR